MVGNKYHVLLAIRCLSGAGAELVLETLCRRIDRRRFEVTVCELVGHGEKGQKLVDLGYNVVSLRPDARARRRHFDFLRLHRLVRTRQVDLVHSHSTASLIDAVLCKTLRPRLKVVHTFHFGNYPHQAPADRRLERLFGRFADKLVAVGHAQAAAIRQTYGLAQDDIRTIWNGIELRPARVDTERLKPWIGSG